ncbi:hypothetical protein SLEP1_g44531 [Rubroshorea leprosula]|uniref:Uncharacterized protein n=1 Tax=Rubroshorea leprosula TaxID=152421 RepID=A0AAV5LGK3_9ROSI|nr:hypothetical protein SLEP1_g44531 [Rubroshorea leprosula]
MELMALSCVNLSLSELSKVFFLFTDFKLGHPLANDMLYAAEIVIDPSIEGMSAETAASISRGYPPANFRENLEDGRQYIIL